MPMHDPFHHSVSQPNIASLRQNLLDANLEDGEIAFVTSVSPTDGRVYFQLNKTSTTTIDNVNVVATSSGAGRWIRLGSGPWVVPGTGPTGLLYWTYSSDPITPQPSNVFKTWAALMAAFAASEVEQTIVIDGTDTLEAGAFNFGNRARLIGAPYPGNGTLRFLNVTPGAGLAGTSLQNLVSVEGLVVVNSDPANTAPLSFEAAVGFTKLITLSRLSVFGSSVIHFTNPGGAAVDVQLVLDRCYLSGYAPIAVDAGITLKVFVLGGSPGSGAASTAIYQDMFTGAGHVTVTTDGDCAVNTTQTLIGAFSFVGQIQSLTSATFQTEKDNGNSGTGTIAIDWTTAQKQLLTLTGSCTLAFGAPAGPCNLMLRLKQGGSGGYSITWPTTARGSGGTIQVGTTVNQYTLLGIYFDGTRYWVTSSANFPDTQATTALV